MRAVFGLDPFDSGAVCINGKETRIVSPEDSIKKKLVMLSENRREEGIIPPRSVVENASLASLRNFIFGGCAHKKKERTVAKEMLGR